MPRRARPAALLAALVVAVAATTLLPGPPAQALTRTWATWTPITGSSNNFATTMQQQSRGFPRATVASDSRSNVQLPAGSSTFLSGSTPPGAKYGSSQGSPYVVLRPRADTPTGASTTTYTFDTPTPDTGWTFVLGDVDSDAVRIRATGEDGTVLPAAEVASWFKDTFNYAGGADLPAWDPLTSTLTGNPGAIDTDGAAAWFEPDVRLTSLTFSFTRRAGFPVYQTWFASFARPIGGQVDDVTDVPGEPTASCPITDAVLTLVSPFGEVLGTTNPAPDGSYSFGEVATQGGYTVRIAAPPSCAVVGPSRDDTVSNAGDDGDAASRSTFELREIVPQPISGVVHVGTPTGPGVPGVEVTVDRPDGSSDTTTTGTDGAYLFDENEIDEGYAVSIDVPDGYAAGPDGTEIEGIEVDDEPVTGQDFVVVEQPAVTGTVTGGGGPLGGVTVTLTPDGGGPARTTITGGDGGYSFPGVPAGGYTVTVAPPAGYGGDASDPVTVAAADEVVDFALTRPGAIGGTVTDEDDAPVADVEVTVDGPGAPTTATTDADGRFFVDGLSAGDYDVSPTPPDGSEVAPGSRDTEITAAGEIRGGLDFTLREVDDPEPTDPPTSTPPTGPTDPTTPPGTGLDPGAGPGSGTGDGALLPDTGGPSLAWLALGLGLVVGGGGLLVYGRRREDV